MKLKCQSHNRRVMTTGNGFLHFTGDNSACDSRIANIGQSVVSLSGRLIVDKRAERSRQARALAAEVVEACDKIDLAFEQQYALDDEYGKP